MKIEIRACTLKRPPAILFFGRSQHFRWRAVAGLCFGLNSIAVTAATPSWITTERSVSKVADGVYVIIHKDAVAGGWPQGNTAVVIGDQSVLVVDTCFLTESAREDIADIRRLTSKPVRYVINTHFHIDHNGGNSAYVDAYPSVQIIAHESTRRLMNDANPSFAANVADPQGRPTTVILPALKSNSKADWATTASPYHPETANF